MRSLIAAASIALLLALVGCNGSALPAEQPSSTAPATTAANDAVVPEKAPKTEVTVNTSAAGCDEAQFVNDCWLPLGASASQAAITGTRPLNTLDRPGTHCRPGLQNRKYQKDCWPANGATIDALCVKRVGDELWIGVHVPDSRAINKKANPHKYNSGGVIGWNKAEYVDGSEKLPNCA